MQVLAVVGIVAAFAVACAAIYAIGRSLQRRGHDLTFIDPHYPHSMQAAPANLDITPPGRPYPEDDVSLFQAGDDNDSPD